MQGATSSPVEEPRPPKPFRNALDAPILWFATLRAVIAGGALLAIAGLQGRPTPRGTRSWVLIGVLAGVNVTVAFAAMFAGVAGLATGTAAVLATRQLGHLDALVASGWHFLSGGAALFLSLVGTAAAFVAWFTEAQHSRLDSLAAWTFAVPMVGVVLAAVVLDERPQGWALVGLSAVLLAMWLALRPRGTAERAADPDLSEVPA